MPAVFEQLGIRFEYPENWSIDEQPLDETLDDGEQITVSSPETGFWQLIKHPGQADLEALFDEALSALRSVYQEIEVEPAQETIDNRQLEGFNVNFYCLDFTNTCWLRGFHQGDATYLLLCQAEDREMERVGPVFLAMLASVLRNLD